MNGPTDAASAVATDRARTLAALSARSERLGALLLQMEDDIASLVALTELLSTKVTHAEKEDRERIDQNTESICAGVAAMTIRSQRKLTDAYYSAHNEWSAVRTLLGGLS